MSKLAEFVGIILGDGSISIRGPKSINRLKISLNSIDDRNYIPHITHLILELFGEKSFVRRRKGENTTYILIFKKKVIEFLTNDIGLILSPKWERAIIPKQFLASSKINHVIRGLFDTDGCVVITNNNGILYPSIEIKICPSPMQEQVINILKDLKFNIKYYDIGKGKIRIQMNGKKQLCKWINEIGFSNPKHENKANFILCTEFRRLRKKTKKYLQKL